jgi:hypothetical protein
MRACVLMVAICLSGCSAVADVDVAIISADRAPEILKQCSRPTPEATGFWTPDDDVVAQAESHLDQITRLPGNINEPRRYLRQYIGILVDGKRLLYINAGADRRHLEHPTDPLVMCDGGRGYWGAVFDATLGEFRDLRINGLG